MPTYDYMCTECGNEEEIFLTISRRKEPTEKPCVKCGGVVIQKVSMPGFAYDNISTSAKPHRVDREFRNRLIDIKKSHHGANMNIPP